jgi:O-antigen ligase
MKNPALGSGAGTFVQNFSLYRPAEFNSESLWQIRFDKSRSRFLEIIGETGLLGGLSYFLIICLVIYLNTSLFKKYF